MFRQRRSLVVRVAVGLSTDATGGILQHSRYPRAQTRRRDVTSSLRPARESTIVRRGDGADHAVAERPRTTRAQRLAGGSRMLRGTVIDCGGVRLCAEETDTREPTVCLPAGAVSAETGADSNNCERNENSRQSRARALQISVRKDEYHSLDYFRTFEGRLHTRIPVIVS